MPEFTIYPIAGDPSHDACEAEFASPEDFQKWSRILPPDMPEGSMLVVRKGISKNKRPTLTVAVQRIGEPVVMPTATDTKPLPPAPVPNALVIPENVKNATEDELETMAARAGVHVNPEWRRRSLALRQAGVAKAMKEKRGVPA